MPHLGATSSFRLRAGAPPSTEQDGAVLVDLPEQQVLVDRMTDVGATGRADIGHPVDEHLLLRQINEDRAVLLG